MMTDILKDWDNAAQYLNQKIEKLNARLESVEKNTNNETKSNILETIDNYEVREEESENA